MCHLLPSLVVSPTGASSAPHPLLLNFTLALGYAFKDYRVQVTDHGFKVMSTNPVVPRGEKEGLYAEEKHHDDGTGIEGGHFGGQGGEVHPLFHQLTPSSGEFLTLSVFTDSHLG